MPREIRSNYFAPEGIAHICALVLPFLLFIVFDVFVLGRNVSTLPEDATSTTMGYGAAWAVGKPVIIKHMPGLPNFQLSALFVWLFGPDVSFRAFNAYGIGIHVLMVIAGAVWGGAFARRNGLPAWGLLVAALAAATLPAMMRYATNWSPYYSFGFLCMLAALPAFVALRDGFRGEGDRAVRAFAAIMGVAITVLYLGAIPLAAMLAVYLWVRRRDLAIQPGLSSRGVALLVLFAFIVLSTGWFGQVLKLLYRATGSFSTSVPLLVGAALLIHVAMQWRAPRRLIGLAAIAAAAQVAIYGIALLAQAYNHTPSIVEPHDIFAVFAATLVNLTLHRQRFYQALMGSPLAPVSIACLLAANVAALFFWDGALMSLVGKGGAAVPKPFGDILAAVDLPAMLTRYRWNLMLPLVLALGVVIALTRRSATESGRVAAVAVLSFLLTMALTIDVSALRYEDVDHSFGMRARYSLPLTFPITLLVLALPRAVAAARWMAAAALVAVSALSFAEYVAVIGPIVRHQQAMIADVVTLVEAERARHPNLRIACGTSEQPPYCDRALGYLLVLNFPPDSWRGPDAPETRQQPERWNGPPTLAIVENPEPGWRAPHWRALYENKHLATHHLWVFANY